MINPNSLKPIFVQIAEWIEEQILKDLIKVGDKIMSQNEFALYFSINAMTAARGVNLLLDKGVLEKRRGIGIFVTSGAKDIILEYRKKENLIEIIDDLWFESKKLGLDRDRLLAMVIQREDTNG